MVLGPDGELLEREEEEEAVLAWLDDFYNTRKRRREIKRLPGALMLNLGIAFPLLPKKRMLHYANLWLTKKRMRMRLVPKED